MLIAFLGAPGAGKGTQAVRLAEFLQVPHLSTGEQLRTEIEAGSELGVEAARFIDQGRLVPDSLVVDLAVGCLTSAEFAEGAVLDGFPRTLVQAQELDLHLAESHLALDCVLHLVVEREELERRLTGRGRDDDSPETVRNRLDIYRAETEPLVQYYADKLLLDVVDGMGDPDDVFARICRAVQRRRARPNP